MKVMVSDLVQATDLANAAVGELKATATEADLALGQRMIGDHKAFYLGNPHAFLPSASFCIAQLFIACAFVQVL